MEYLRNVWDNVTYVVSDWWNYLFGIKGSQQLLLEYVIMDEDLSSRYVYTGDDKHEKKKKTNIRSNDNYKQLIESHNSVSLANGSNYTFLFEQNEC